MGRRTDKYPVTVYGRDNSFIRAEEGATAGATVGLNVYAADGVTLHSPAVLTTPLRLPTYTVAALPAGVQGDKAFVSNALSPAFLAAVAAGGTVVTPVFHNGTAWICG